MVNLLRPKKSIENPQFPSLINTMIIRDEEGLVLG